MDRVPEEIKELASKIGRIKGVQAVLMFGSYSRGEFDEGSDVDILVLFSDEKDLKMGRKKVWKLASRSKTFVQVITMTLREIRSSPLLTSLLRDGIILSRKGNFDLRKIVDFFPVALISYDLRGLDRVEKVKVLHRIYGRKGKRKYAGIVEEVGGFRVSRGSFIVPYDKVRYVLSFLDKKEVPYVVRYFWIPKVKEADILSR